MPPYLNPNVLLSRIRPGLPPDLSQVSTKYIMALLEDVEDADHRQTSRIQSKRAVSIWGLLQMEIHPGWIRQAYKNGSYEPPPVEKELDKDADHKDGVADSEEQSEETDTENDSESGVDDARHEADGREEESNTSDASESDERGDALELDESTPLDGSDREGDDTEESYTDHVTMLAHLQQYLDDEKTEDDALFLCGEAGVEVRAKDLQEAFKGDEISLDLMDAYIGVLIQQ